LEGFGTASPAVPQELPLKLPGLPKGKIFDPLNENDFQQLKEMNMNLQ